ncbi:MAG: SDR family NAD(P)-dependent oxidoreductase [Caulobacteraceae bacterium]
MGALDGQVALVTGGASGIGRAVVERYVREGARVGVADVDAAGLASLKAALGDEVVVVEADLTTPAGAVAAVRRTVDAFGKLDVLVGNAGIFDSFTEFADLSIEQVAEGYGLVFGVNVLAQLLVARAALPELVKTEGSIIFTLSNSSLYPDGGGVMYVASKHADLGIMRQLAHELAPVIRVNGVAPGATRTPIRTPAVFGEQGGPAFDSPEMDQAIEPIIPIGIPGRARGPCRRLCAARLARRQPGDHRLGDRDQRRAGRARPAPHPRRRFPGGEIPLLRRVGSSARPECGRRHRSSPKRWAPLPSQMQHDD